MGKRWWVFVGSLVAIGCITLLPATANPKVGRPIPLAHAASPASQYGASADYPIGNPTLTELWIDTVNGQDSATGADRAHPLRTVTAAWQQIPAGAPFTTTGYRLQLLPGDYPESSFPEYWEDRHGTADFPIILQAADGAHTVRMLGDLNLFQISYFYLLDITVQQENDVFHCEQCSYLLLRNNTFLGTRTSSHENIKINQSQHIYLENNEINGAEQNAVDFVAVQYGHIRHNHIHNADDWCIYLKGGSAYFRIEGNEIDNCGTGGFTAGEGTGFEYLVNPWLHYEAYDLKVVNNLIHDTDGAGLGVHGGYNILYAYNTLYRIGARSHLLEIGFGSRSCDGDTNLPGRCASNLAVGGWGTTTVGSEGEPIPNRHVYIYNNIFYNPSTYQSQWQQITVDGPRTPGGESHIPTPAQSDDDLVLRGNVIWNGPTDHPIGLDDESGCQPVNPTCNVTQLYSENTINAQEPMLTNPALGDFRPVAAGNLFAVQTFALPDFPTWESLNPSAPSGERTNSVAADFAGLPRQESGPPGALTGSETAQGTATPVSVTPTTVPSTTASQPPITTSRQIYLPAVHNANSTRSPTTVPTLVATMPTARPTATPSLTATPSPPATATVTSVATPSATAPSQPLPPGPLTVITLGDSLTEGQGDERGEGGGYPRRLYNTLSNQRPGTTVSNLGRSGWSSDDLINGVNGEPSQLTTAVDQLQQAGGARLALVWIGSNDLWYLYEYNNPDDADELADQAHFRANVETILAQLQAAGATVIMALLDDQSLRPVVANPPNPAEPAFPGISEAERLRMSAQVTAYNAIIRNRAAAHGVILVDFFDTTIFIDAATLADDGNHPNASGYDAITTRWQAAIVPLLGP